MKKITLHVNNETFPIVKMGTVKGNFYMLYEFDTDYCTHGLSIIDRIPKNMEKETLEQFLHDSFNEGYGNCGTLEEMEKELENFLKEFENERTRICGIMMEHGNDDFGFWEGFNLTEEDENAIYNILAKYDTQGCSVRGTRKEVLDDIM